MRLVVLPLALIAIVATIGLASRDGGAPELARDPAVRLVEIGRFDQPTHVAAPAGDDRLFVVEKPGRVQVVVGGKRLERPFLDISGRVSASGLEEGLLSIAFAPDYATSGRFYVDYTDLEHRTVVEEYRRRADDANRADPGSARRVLVIPNPTDRHHGGHVLFGPDGLLYISQGDGGLSSDENYPAQRLDTLRGKILRIDPRASGGRPYRTPADNPFVGRPGRDEIWAYGLRNPWRIAFDPATDALLVGDVGQLSVEEIDVAPSSGLNFGWNCFEGTMQYIPQPPSSCDDILPPALERFRVATRSGGPPDAEPTVTRGRARVDARLTTGEAVCSVVLGVVVRDPRLGSLRGRTLHGDACDRGLHSFRLEDGVAVDPRPLGVEIVQLSSFGVDGQGRVHAASLLGPVYRLEPAA